MGLNQFLFQCRLGLGAWTDALRTGWAAAPARQRRLELVELEERILLSATPASVAAEQVAEQQAPAIPPATPSGSDAAGTGTVEAAAGTGVTGDAAAATAGSPQAASAPQHTAPAETLETPRRELVFIDGSVADPERLLQDFQDPADHDDAERELEVVRLAADRDGLEQIAEVLAGRTDLDAVHFVTHGREGAVKLGSTWLDTGLLAARADEVAAWSESLSADADLVFYGCDLAGGEAGRGFVTTLGALTGADVAASTDDTGHAALGGDWDLEHAAGAVETGAALTAAARQEWFALLAPTAPGTAIWADGGLSGPQFSGWDGVSFETADNAPAVGTWQIIQGAAAPTRDEAIVVGVDSSGRITGMMWDGNTWSALPFGTLATVSTPGNWGFDVRYESQSGDAVLVWNNGTTGSAPLSYRVWDGSSWSAEQTIATPRSGAADQLQLASNPAADGMVLVVSNASSDEYALVWGGSAWGNAQVLDTSNPGQKTEIAVAYESQSGHALVFYDGIYVTPDINYRIWDGTAWSSQLALAAPSGVDGNGDAQISVIASDPNSDCIALGVVTGIGANEVWFAVWDGSSWGSKILGTSSSPTSGAPVAAVAFESESGALLATYANTSNVVRYRTWTSGGGWSAEQIGPDLGGTPGSMTLDADPHGDQVMLSVVDSNNDVHFVLWDGSAWGGDNELETNAGTSTRQPFLFLWDSAEPNVPPTIGTTAGSLAYTEGDGAVIVDGGLTVADPDSTNLTGATVQITGNYVSGEDVLSFTNQFGITGSWDAASGTLTLSGVASVANYQSALRSVTYTNTSQDPGTATRTVTVTATDDGATSPAATRDVVVTPVNDAPTTPDTNASGAEDAASIAVTLSGSDVDGTVTHFRLSSLPANGLLYTDASLTTAAAIGVDYAAASGSLTLYFVPSADWSGVTTFQFTAKDDQGALGSTPATATISVTAVNDPPTVSTNTGRALVEGGSATIGATQLGTTDPDNAPAQLTYTVTTAPANGRLELTTDPGVAVASFTQADVDSGRLVYVHDGSETTADSFTFTVSDGMASTAADTFALTITPVNDAPSITSDSLTIAENTAVPTLVGTVSASDVDAGDTLSFAITAGNGGGAFAIDALTGEVRVANPAALDFESSPVFNLTVQVTDSGGLSEAAAVTVLLTDVYEPPPPPPPSSSEPSPPPASADPDDEPPPASTDPDDEPPPYPSPGSPGSDSHSDSDSDRSNKATEIDTDGEEDSGDSDDELALDLAVIEALTGETSAIRPARTRGAAGAAGPQEAAALLASAGTLSAGAMQQDVLLVGADERSLRTITDGPPLPQSGARATEESGGSGVFSLPATPFDRLALTRNLDQLADELQQDVEKEQAFESLVVGSTAVVTTGLTVGYLVWALRGGSLLATMISALPAWTLIDPLPILDSIEPRPDEDGEPDDPTAGGRPGGDAGADDSLHGLVTAGTSGATGRAR